MHLDPRELELLARFFAKRFPHPADRAAMLDRAGLLDSEREAPLDAWTELLERAQVQGALIALGRAARSDDPHDTNLREVRRLLVGEPERTWSWAAAGLGAAAGLVFVVGLGVVWAMWPTGRTRAIEQPKVSVASVDPSPASEALVSAAGDEAAPPDPVEVEPEPPPQPAGALVVGAGTALPGRRHVTADHCFRKDPEVAGFWYAGTELPGRPGDVIVIPQDVYVRAEVPSARNGYDTRTEVQCVLYEGDRVRLGQDPVHVPVDTWWVAMRAADVVAAGGQQVRDQGRLARAR